MEDNDPDIVENLLLYCYTDGYDDGVCSGKSKMKVNALLYALADKSGIISLKGLAKDKFSSSLAAEPITEPMTKAFPEVAWDAFQTTPASDRGLRDLVFKKCTTHLSTLLKDETFNQLLMENPELASELLRYQHDQATKLRKSVQTWKDWAEKKVKMGKEWQTKVDAAGKVAAGIKERAEKWRAYSDWRLSKLPSCCRHCDHEFKSYFYDSNYVLRCGYCRTRHFQFQRDCS